MFFTGNILKNICTTVPTCKWIKVIKKVFEDNPVSEAQIKSCYQCFKFGEETIENDLNSERPSINKTTDNVEFFKNCIQRKSVVDIVRIRMSRDSTDCSKTIRVILNILLDAEYKREG